MEKQGVIKPGLTPPETPTASKTAAEADLESHTTKRLAEAAAGGLNPFAETNRLLKKLKDARPSNQHNG